MDYLTCEQVAEIAHCSIFRVRKAVQNGEIAAFKPAKTYLFTREAVDKWIKKTQVAKR